MGEQYIMKRNAESPVAAMAVRAGAGTGIGGRVRARARARASTVETNNDNKKKRLKMRLFLNLFIRKPVLRDTILFHLLRDYQVDLMDTDHFRNRYGDSGGSSNLAKNKRKRTTDDEGDK